MLWARLRVVAVAAIGIGIASGRTGVLVFMRGAQEAATKDEPPASKGTPAPAAQLPKTKSQNIERHMHLPAPTTPATLKAQQFVTRKAKVRY